MMLLLLAAISFQLYVQWVHLFDVEPAMVARYMRSYWPITNSSMPSLLVFVGSPYLLGYIPRLLVISPACWFPQVAIDWSGGANIDAHCAVSDRLVELMGQRGPPLGSSFPRLWCFQIAASCAIRSPFQTRIINSGRAFSNCWISFYSHSLPLEENGDWVSTILRDA